MAPQGATWPWMCGALTPETIPFRPSTRIQINLALALQDAMNLPHTTNKQSSSITRNTTPTYFPDHKPVVDVSQISERTILLSRPLQDHNIQKDTLQKRKNKWKNQFS